MRHPSVEGLAVASYDLGYTVPTVADFEVAGRVEMHHRYHSKAWYNPESDGYGAWRQVFRNMEVNIDPLLTTEHNRGYRGAIHDKYEPPKMPKDATMIDFVESQLASSGVILIHNYKRSLPPRIITPKQWKNITRRYKSGHHQG